MGRKSARGEGRYGSAGSSRGGLWPTRPGRDRARGAGGRYPERAKRARLDIHRVYGRVGGGCLGEQIDKKKGAALTTREHGINTSERSEHNSGRLANQ